MLVTRSEQQAKRQADALQAKLDAAARSRREVEDELRQVQQLLDAQKELTANKENDISVANKHSQSLQEKVGEGVCVCVCFVSARSCGVLAVSDCFCPCPRLRTWSASLWANVTSWMSSLAARASCCRCATRWLSSSPRSAPASPKSSSSSVS